MSFEIFISILVVSATATSIFIDIVKQLLDNRGKEYDSVTLATICAFIIGVAEVFIFYVIKGINIGYLTFVYSICMGIANSVSSQVG